MAQKKILHLNLKGEYFDQIKSGQKTEEFRRVTPYWQKRLVDDKGQPIPYDGILIKRGYPRRTDTDRILERKWEGWTIREITHPHFGDKPVKVFAISVTQQK